MTRDTAAAVAAQVLEERIVVGVGGPVKFKGGNCPFRSLNYLNGPIIPTAIVAVRNQPSASRKKDTYQDCRFFLPTILFLNLLLIILFIDHISSSLDRKNRSAPAMAGR